MSKIIDAIPLPPVYYHATEASYWRQGEKKIWIKINETSAKNFVVDYGYNKTVTTTGANSEAERCLMKMQSSNNVAYVGPLAGYAAGIYLMANKSVLVTDAPRLITPKAGDWPTLDALFTGLLADEAHDQRSYFYGWIKSAMNSFQNCHWKASQLLALAGPVGSGKSLTQNLLTQMFGGRSVKPFQVMMKDTNFNSHMFGAEHLMLEDEAESVDIRARRHFAANIKTMLTNQDQNCHGKNREAFTLQPIWRMSLSLNDEPERLLVLPPFDADIRDKILALKISKKPMPMDTGDSEADKRFWQKLVSELPAFLHFIDNYEVPAGLQDGRYGIAAFQHPDIVDKIQETAPELTLLELIDKIVFRRAAITKPWDGTASQLESQLLEDNDCNFRTRRLLSGSNATGTYLARLKDSKVEHARGRVISRKVQGRTIWTIEPEKTTDTPATKQEPAVVVSDAPDPVLPKPPVIG